MKRRIFAFLLSVAMMISLIVPAYAETDDFQAPVEEITCDLCTVVDGAHAADCPSLTSADDTASQPELVKENPAEEEQTAEEGVSEDDLVVDAAAEADVVEREDTGRETATETVGQLYIVQAEALLAQAEALDTDAEDLDAQCKAISDAIWLVVDDAQIAWEAGEMTDEEMDALIAVANATETVLDGKTTADTPAEDDVVVYADTSMTILQGGYANCTYYNNVSSVTVTSTLPDGITVSVSNSRIRIAVGRYVPAGTYTVSGSYAVRSSGGSRPGSGSSATRNFSIDVTVTDKIKVYVYVGTNDGNGGSWADNPEFLDLLGIGANTVDANNYFPVGEIYLNASYLVGKEEWSNEVGAALIRSEDDWVALEAALSAMDTTTLNNEYAVNRYNKVPEYLDQAIKDIGAVIGSQQTALFRWDMTTSYGFDDQSVEFHLDLRFNTKKITFITGNNGISSGNAKDGMTVDSRVYITGSEIQEPRNLDIPDGYRFIGYYEDADFTIPWDGIGTPLNEDQVVYIKITEMENVVVHYAVAEGEGTVSPEEEAFNPKTGNPEGSVAAAGDGHVFSGWYADAECTELLSENIEFVPDAPADGWEEGGTYYYYAKFEKVQADLTIFKELSGIEKSDVDAETFVFTVANSTETHTVKLPTSSGSWSYTLTDLDLGEWSISEEAGTVSNYSLTGTTVSGDAESNNASVAVALLEDKIYSVTFTNSYQPAASDVEDVTFITVQKEFAGITENQIPDDFTITVKDSTGKAVATLKVTDSDVEKNGMVYTWKVHGLSAGSYTVEESGADVTNFDIAVDGVGSVTTQASNMSVTSEGVDSSCNSTSKAIGTVNLMFAKLTKNEGYFVWSDIALSANQRQTVATYLGTTVDKLHCYSGDKIDDADGLMFRGGTIRYDRDAVLNDGDEPGVVYFSNPKQWARLEWAIYSMVGGVNPEIDITNTYTPNTGALKIEKIVEKAYENDDLPDDVFTFTVDVNGEGSYRYNVYTTGDENNNVVLSGFVTDNGTLTLAGGQYAIIEDVPVGDYTVTEVVDDDYVTEASGDTGTIASNETSEAVFTNTYKKHVFDLTITKAGVAIEDDGAPFVFNVTGDGVNLNVVIYGNSSVTIRDLPIGTYTVTETSGYWRYNINAASYGPSSKVVIEDSDQAVTVTNIKTNDSWLDAFARATNIFKN